MSIQHINKILLALLSVLPLLALSDPPPNRANVAKIYNLTEKAGQPIDVRYFRKHLCSEDKWCPIKKAGEELFPSDFFLTGNISRADLALLQSVNSYRGIIFWQAEGSRSQFVPKEGTCHFKVEQGKFIYAHVDSNVDPGCREITSNEALIYPHTTLAIFRRISTQETAVYVLSGSPLGPVRVRSPISGKTVTLKTGQYAIARGDGSIQVDEFDVADFLGSEQALTLGIGACPKDQGYIKQQPAEIQPILLAIQKSTSGNLSCDDIRRPPPPPPPCIKTCNTIDTCGGDGCLKTICTVQCN